MIQTSFPMFFGMENPKMATEKHQIVLLWRKFNFSSFFRLFLWIFASKIAWNLYVSLHICRERHSNSSRYPYWNPGAIFYPFTNPIDIQQKLLFLFSIPFLMVCASFDFWLWSFYLLSRRMNNFMELSKAEAEAENTSPTKLFAYRLKNLKGQRGC